VLLLVVLSLLVLFAMIAVTFVLVAGQYRRTSRAAGRAEQSGDDPQRQVDEVFSQLVRDTNDPKSSLFRHSLLADIYGLDGVTGTIGASPAQVSSGAGVTQFYDIVTPTLNRLPGQIYPTSVQTQATGYYNGCVLTITSGAAKNTSMRIVGWGYSGGSYLIRVMPLDVSDPNALVFANWSGQSFVINGRPFNGAGFGFNPNADPTSATIPTLLNAQNSVTNSYEALLPNPKLFPTIPAPPATYPAFGGLGGPDEDYDVADAQNMHLAYLPIGPIVNPNTILPSFHRQDLINHLKTNAVGGRISLEIARRSILRPFGPTTGLAPGVTPDHPAFTGSNALGQFDPINGPWDVDNDGDGVTDSIWIDVGLPIQTAADGRRFKPLAAIHCTDLDGRLNVNAHGNPIQAQDSYYTVGATGPNKAVAYLFKSTGPPANVPIPARGMGYGPAEINLNAIDVNLFPSINDCRNFYNGMTVGGVIYEGRYGDYMMAGGALPGTQPGSVSGDSKLERISNFALPIAGGTSPPYSYNYYTSPLSVFGSPPDFAGRALLGIDYAGQPLYSFARLASGTSDILATADNEFPNNPYSFNLSRNRARASTVSPSNWGDNAFTATELERILRQYDLDATGLPDRLRYLVNPGGAIRPELAQMVTTDSFDLPSPSVLPTRDMAALMRGQNTAGPLPNTVVPTVGIVDLLIARLTQRGYTGNVNQAIQQMLPPEVIAGQKFDLNRPLGNGLDDNTNGAVDEADEYVTNSEATTFGGTSASTTLDLNNDGSINTNPAQANAEMYARQQYAKYLYVMMMLLTDQGFAWSTETIPPNYAELTARRIAQWAINVVDFRDSDGIMTPFEYDVNPFNGWSVDGVVGYGSPDDSNPGMYPDRRIVWGCEAPEVVLTETLAFHDRRVDDTNTDKKTDDPMMKDKDYDQVRVPQGSLFLELYCTGNGNNSVAAARSGDLYTNTAGVWKLDLAKLALAGGGYQYPVWRVVITSSTTASPANNLMQRLHPSAAGSRPDTSNFDPVPVAGVSPGSVFDTTAPGPVTAERVVWFTNGIPNIPQAEKDISFCNTGGFSPAGLSPGQYAVVGPRPTTYVGLANGLAAPQTFSFNLSAQGPFNYTPANAGGPNSSSSYPALPIICSLAMPPTGWGGSPIGLNVSEPMPQWNLGVYIANTYYQTPTMPGPTGETDTYPAPLDKPLDGSNDGPVTIPNAPLVLAGYTTGVRSNFKNALLQRLANPLIAFDAVANPYITVDWQAIDLAVFNGQATPPAPDPDDGTAAALTTLKVGSRERSSLVPTMNSNFWNLLNETDVLSPAYPTSPRNVTPPIAVFDFNIYQSLGFLNRSLGRPWAGGAPTTMVPANQAYANAPDPTQGTQHPFPWLTWNNRPYVGAHELMMVPATSAEELMRRFSTDSGMSPYAPGTGAFQAPFGHLFNFFMTADAAGPAKASYLYRILDYVHVPSRFIGTETMLNPQRYATFLPTQPREELLASQYHPPFNRVSNYREPGRININTMNAQVGAPTSPAWNAILNGAQATPAEPTFPNWQSIVESRRGYTTGGTNVLTFDSNRPSVFSNPFRSAGGAAFTLPNVTPTPPNEADVTLMRPKLGLDKPLFSSLAGFANSPTYANPDRSAYFRFQPLQKISNLVTTRSNVYAVWITVGYFEATPNLAGVDAAHPDGYQYGAELGSDTGEVKRRRGFYIYDRSIPVGFEPGKDHNIDRGILVKRFIE